ncbi:MAG: SH3 domain-containing protein [Chloroflexota bacterium]
MKKPQQSAALVIILIIVLVFALMPMIGAQADSGVNWTGSYYNSTDLSGSVVYTEALPSGIDINWGTGSPNPAVNVDNFSARFTSVQLFNAGVYEFVVSSDDGVRLFIDGVVVLDKFIGRILTTDRVQQTLTAGTHSLTVEYVEFTDQAALRVQWFQISGGGTPGLTPGISFLTPGVNLLTPTAAYTGPLATVSGARGLALRTGPYLGASFITTLIGEQAYPVLARNRDEGIYNWYKLQVGERVGWASGRFLTISVDINTLPVQGSIFDEIDGAADIGARAYPRAVMNLRTRPSLRMPEITNVPWGADLELIGRTVQAGENQWLHVRYNGIVGWVDASWVTVRGEIFQVPVR